MDAREVVTSIFYKRIGCTTYTLDWRGGRWQLASKEDEDARWSFEEIGEDHRLAVIRHFGLEEVGGSYLLAYLRKVSPDALSARKRSLSEVHDYLARMNFL